MDYELVYTKQAMKDIKGLDVVVRKKLKKKLELYVKEPLGYARKLTNSSLGDYRWRMGNYRVIFDVDEKKIVVLRVRHRREVYR